MCIPRLYTLLLAGWMLALLPCPIGATSPPRRISLPRSHAGVRQVYQVTASLGGMGTGNFVPPDTNAEPGVDLNPGSVAVGDVDGDLDLVTANYRANTVSVRWGGPVKTDSELR